MFNSNAATNTNTRTEFTADVAAAAANNELEDSRPPHALHLSHSATADGSSCVAHQPYSRPKGILDFYPLTTSVVRLLGPWDRN